LAWTIKFTERVDKQLSKLDRPVFSRLIAFLETRIAGAGDPRALGDALAGELTGFWRYRVGDWRIICEIQDEQVVVLVIELEPPQGNL
jgi:mRNA interferase RelE/StbE